MADFPSYGIDDLENFANVPEDSFAEFGENALFQATFLVQERTGIHVWPTTARLQTALKLAIMDVAVRLYYESFYMKYKYSPFTSETAGGHSYSKGNTADTALYSARPTGIRWFDILLDMLSKDDAALLGGVGVAGGGVSVFEHDGVVGDQGYTPDGWVPGPKDWRIRPSRGNPAIDPTDFY